MPIHIFLLDWPISLFLAEYTDRPKEFSALSVYLDRLFSRSIMPWEDIVLSYPLVDIGRATSKSSHINPLRIVANNCVLILKSKGFKYNINAVGGNKWNGTTLATCLSILDELAVCMEAICETLLPPTALNLFLLTRGVWYRNTIINTILIR
mgnify:FL=1